MGCMQVSNADLVVAGHQPNFFPWFGYFEKMLGSDIFVFSDDVQYTKQNYVNRVAYPEGRDSTPRYLTLPVCRGDDYSINAKKYVKDKKALDKIIKTIEINMGGLPFFSDLEEVIRNFAVDYQRFETVADLNISTNIRLAKLMGITATTKRGCDIGLSGWHSNQRLLRRQEILQSRVYLSGAGSSEYTDFEAFESRGIRHVTITYSLGPKLFGDSLKFTVLYGIASVGLNVITRAVDTHKKHESKP